MGTAVGCGVAVGAGSGVGVGCGVGVGAVVAVGGGTSVPVCPTGVGSAAQAANTRARKAIAVSGSSRRRMYGKTDAPCIWCVPANNFIAICTKSRVLVDRTAGLLIRWSGQQADGALGQGQERVWIHAPRLREDRLRGNDGLDGEKSCFWGKKVGSRVSLSEGPHVGVSSCVKLCTKPDHFGP